MPRSLSQRPSNGVSLTGLVATTAVCTVALGLQAGARGMLACAKARHCRRERATVAERRDAAATRIAAAWRAFSEVRLSVRAAQCAWRIVLMRPRLLHQLRAAARETCLAEKADLEDRLAEKDARIAELEADVAARAAQVAALQHAAEAVVVAPPHQPQRT